MEPTLLLVHIVYSLVVVSLSFYQEEHSDAEIKRHATTLYQFLRDKNYLGPHDILIYGCVRHHTQNIAVLVVYPKLANTRFTVFAAKDLVRQFIHWNQEQQQFHPTLISAVLNLDAGTPYTIVNGPYSLDRYDCYFTPEAELLSIY